MKRYLAMKNTISIFNLGLIISFILISCELKNDSGFSIKFSDGSAINEKDIVFYDSSTCNLFLNDELHLNYVLGEPPNVDYIEFSVYVDKDIIYQGIVYPALVAAPSPEPSFIASYSYPTFESDIVPIRHISIYPNSVDNRNHTRIISFLDNNDLLHHGISCSIDSINISFKNDSSVSCTFTIKNNDNINYYIPDPAKMGAERFNFCLGGLYLKSKEINEDIFQDYINYPGWEILTMDDFSILESKSQVTFNYVSSYNLKINKGIYECNFYYHVLGGCVTISVALNQEDGRVWAGDLYLSIDNILIE